MQIIPKVPSFAEEFARNLGGGISKGLSQTSELQMHNEKLKQQQNQELSKKKKMVDLLVGRGIDPNDAELYAQLTTGGQTEFAKDILESRKRGGNTFGDRVNKPINKLEKANQSSAEENEDEEIFDMISSEDEGLTPKERVKRESERFPVGYKAYEEASTKLRGLTRDKHRLDILNDLSKSKKLPKDFGRLNVDAEGNLKFPFASSAESQRYVKTLNEFSENAKDTFGARVTNFDLQQYFKRFPSLLNSEEGRKQVIEQMKVVNDINAIYYKNLKKVYDKAGGVRKIDADVAESLADRMSMPQIEKLSKKFSEIGQFSSLPSASEFKGKKIRDKSTGEILVSDGNEWVAAE